MLVTLNVHMHAYPLVVIAETDTDILPCCIANSPPQILMQGKRILVITSMDIIQER